MCWRKIIPISVLMLRERVSRGVYQKSQLRTFNIAIGEWVGALTLVCVRSGSVATEWASLEDINLIRA